MIPKIACLSKSSVVAAMSRVAAVAETSNAILPRRAIRGAEYFIVVVVGIERNKIRPLCPVMRRYALQDLWLFMS
jgi:hypothetical protein